MRLRRFAGTHALALVVLGLALLAGLPHQNRRPTPEADPKAPELPETPPVPLAVVPVSASEVPVVPTPQPAPVRSPAAPVAVPASKGGDAPRPLPSPVPSTPRAARSAPRAVPATLPPGAAAHHMTVVSTAYSYGCGGGWRTASGAQVYEGEVAMNILPLGTTIVILSGDFTGTVETVLDRIGWGSQLDFYVDTCERARQYGRQEIEIAVP